MLEYKKIVLYLTGTYIISLSLHYWNINSLRVSEIVFLLLFVVFLFGIFKKYIRIKISKSDIIIGFFLITNLIFLITNNHNLNGVLSAAFSLYLFLIYYIFRNILQTYTSDLILKYVISD